jgi:hypothetical protein
MDGFWIVHTVYFISIEGGNAAVLNTGNVSRFKSVIL